ncbi:MAG TPA: META domain-containing protein [Casimicrobiaceae bacterium]|nr:META domain-containing protein [Casimicrobiaceae bacterium]
MNHGLIACALALAVSACQDMPQAGLAPSAAPAYVPANAMPPIVTNASDALVGPEWQWQRTHLGAAPQVVAASPGRYTLAFQAGGRVNVRADCNSGSGSYEVNGTQMKFGAIALTRMMCPQGSQDGEFLRSLAQVTGYTIAGGELLLTLADGATMRFRTAS